MDQSAADHGRSCLAEKSLTTDVAIVGAGPVGLFAVFECGMLKLRCHVIDTLEMIGGQCAALYPEKPIYDIPGYPRIVAQELVDRSEEHTSELQSLMRISYAVFCLKKKNNTRHTINSTIQPDCRRDIPKHA